jgi:hypothetical protein
LVPSYNTWHGHEAYVAGGSTPKTYDSTELPDLGTKASDARLDAKGRGTKT